MKLYPHQMQALDHTAVKNRVAYYLDMGLGKTYVGAEKMIQLGKRANLVICQKSKVNDWYNHLAIHYAVGQPNCIYDLTNKEDYEVFFKNISDTGLSHMTHTGIINYELAWRRKQLLQLQNFTLMLDESSIIQNPTTKQTKFVMKLQPSNVILLSGTPCSGKYENLVTQANLLGWDISQEIYDRTYINYKLTEDDGSGVRHRIVDMDHPYKNVDRLKAKLRQYGAVFMKTEEVLDLPEQNFIEVMVDAPKTYKKFMKDDIVTIDDYDDTMGTIELIGDTTFTKRLYARQLCSQYNQNKIDALKDLIQSTSDRLIIFYNFNEELHILKSICDSLQKPYSEVNGSVKDLTYYDQCNNSITLVQYKAGAMGLNLQKCNKIIYFSLPEMSELFEQSKKRIHRIGQSQPCFYYIMMSKNTIERDIYETLKLRKDYTDDLFVFANNNKRIST